MKKRATSKGSFFANLRKGANSLIDKAEDTYKEAEKSIGEIMKEGEAAFFEARKQGQGIVEDLKSKTNGYFGLVQTLVKAGVPEYVVSKAASKSMYQKYKEQVNDPLFVDNLESLKPTTANLLKGIHIYNLKVVAKLFSRETLNNVPGFGPASLDQIEQALGENNLTWKKYK